MSFYVSLQVSRIHCSSFLSSTASITLPRSESQPTVLCHPPPNSPSVLLDGAVLITSDLTVIGPARLHQGDPSTVAWVWPLRLSPHDLGVRCGALGARGMNNMRRERSRAYKQSITIHNVGSLLCLSRNLTARPSSLILSCHVGGGGGISLSSLPLCPCNLAKEEEPRVHE